MAQVSQMLIIYQQLMYHLLADMGAMTAYRVNGGNTLKQFSSLWSCTMNSIQEGMAPMLTKQRRSKQLCSREEKIFAPNCAGCNSLLMAF